MDEITIIGAGPVGALLAIGLARRGFQVTLYEGRPDPRLAPPAPGRSINLTLAERGWRALRQVEVAEAIRDVSIPLHSRLIHGEDGRTRVQPYGLNGESIYSASRSVVWVRLLDLTRDYPNIKIHFEHRCRSVNLEKRTVSFDRPEGGEAVEIKPQRLIGADGAYSTVRRALLRDDSFQFFQRFSRIQYKEVVLPAKNGDYPFANNLLHLWPRGECMVVAFPNLDKSMTATLFLPSTGDVSFEAINSWPDLKAFGDANFPDLMAAAPELRHDFFARPPSLLVTTRSSPWTYGDWLTLIGDAAHSLVPFLGQGLNAGFEDCTGFWAAVDRHRGDWHQILAAYEHERRENCDTVTQMAEQHYRELAQAARDPSFVISKALEQKVHRLASNKFIPLYNLISFHDTPYKEAQRRSERQSALIARLMALPDIAARWDSPEVEVEIRRLLEDLPGTN